MRNYLHKRTYSMAGFYKRKQPFAKMYLHILGEMPRLLKWNCPIHGGYAWRLFIPMKTQLTDTSSLTPAMLL